MTCTFPNSGGYPIIHNIFHIPNVSSSDLLAVVSQIVGLSALALVGFSDGLDDVNIFNLSGWGRMGLLSMCGLRCLRGLGGHFRLVIQLSGDRLDDVNLLNFRN